MEQRNFSGGQWNIWKNLKHSVPPIPLRSSLIYAVSESNIFLERSLTLQPSQDCFENVVPFNNFRSETLNVKNSANLELDGSPSQEVAS